MCQDLFFMDHNITFAILNLTNLLSFLHWCFHRIYLDLFHDLSLLCFNSDTLICFGILNICGLCIGLRRLAGTPPPGGVSRGGRL